MIDRTISANTTIAYALWIVGGAFVILNLFVEAPLGAVGLYVAGAGGVTQIRGFFCAQRQREQDAYDMGRETVRRLH